MSLSLSLNVVSRPDLTFSQTFTVLVLKRPCAGIRRDDAEFAAPLGTGRNPANHIFADEQQCYRSRFAEHSQSMTRDWPHELCAPRILSARLHCHDFAEYRTS